MEKPTVQHNGAATLKDLDSKIRLTKFGTVEIPIPSKRIAQLWKSQPVASGRPKSLAGASKSLPPLICCHMEVVPAGAGDFGAIKGPGNRLEQ